MNRTAIRPMPPRDPHEAHRAATPLELLFDLVTVIAIAAAAAGLHHAIAENHVGEGIVHYMLAFFAIWWAWMNFTWFASAYDNDDSLYRMLTMVIMGGSLLLAAGTERFFTRLDISLVVGGYVIMRVGMVALWLRAARHDPARRTTALRYAIGIALAQIYWTTLVLLASPESGLFIALMLIGFLIELAVPAFAERASVTPWHRHHIVERYGLLNIIVLGEVLLAAVTALQSAWDGSFDIRLVHIALSALVISFAMWWLYFADGEHLRSATLSDALQWGYGHILIFAAGAAVGAGFAVLADIVAGHSEQTIRNGDLAVAIPLALYIAGIWLVHDRLTGARGAARYILPGFALAIALLPFAFPALEVIAALTVGAVVVRSRLARPAS